MDQMTNMSGEAWKEVRSVFSPIFTSGKLKSMLHFVKGVAESLANEFDAKAKQGTDFELKEVFGKFREIFTNLAVHSNFIFTYYYLKGQSNEIFDLHFFHY